MQITSLGFFIIVIICLAIYWILPLKIQWCFLLISSAIVYFIYATPYTFIYIVASVVSVHIATIFFDIVERKYENNSEEVQEKKRKILIFTLVINIGILAALKYTNLGINTVNFIAQKVFVIDFNLSNVNWVAPLAISYYTLQLVAYLLDCYWGSVKAYKNPFKLALYTCYFPQMLTGPISRFSQIDTQLFEEHRFDFDRVAFGIQRVVWGLFKKLVIAERLAVLVNPVYADVQAYSWFVLLYTAMLFVVQLYMDFSGGMDIILGVSECFGIFLPDNFKNPFFATTVQEFWQRWHITLGTWLKDYIMYPVLKSKSLGRIRNRIKIKYGKKLAKKLPTYLGMLVLWLAMGLWHGNSWKYIIGEGLWFWLIIVLSDACENLIVKITDFLNIRTKCFSFKLFRMIRTFIIVCVGNVFFRAESLSDALTVLKRIITFAPGIQSGRLGTYETKILLLAMVIWFIFAIVSENRDVRMVLARQNIWFRWGVYIGMVFMVLLWGLYGIECDDSEFLYQNF